MPGKVYVETYGCWLNKAASEAIKQVVKAAGGVIVENVEAADTVIVNTCAVRGDTERKMLDRVGRLSSLGKRVCVTGCLVNVRPYTISRLAPTASIIDPGELHRVAEFLAGGNPKVARSGAKAIPIYEYRGGVRYILPVEVGCLGSCGFCVERVVRGPGVLSLDVEEAVRLVRGAVRGGVKEVYLTGQDLAAYGADRNLNIAMLLRAILEEVDGDYRIRLGMMEPWLLSGVAEELAELMRDYRVYKYLHIPVQSGDDGVLRMMNRRYTVEQYERLVGVFRGILGEASIVTDIIVGYPGETETAFLNSVKLVEKLLFDKVHVARYTFRPFTAAYVVEKQVPEPEKKRRSRILSEAALRVALRINQRYVGKVLQTLVTEPGRRGGTFISRTDTYKPVVLGGEARIGEWVKVRVTGATPTHLIGEVVD